MARVRPGLARGMLTLACWVGVAHAHLVLFLPPAGFASAKEKVESALLGRIGINPLGFLPAVSKLPPGSPAGWLAAGWCLMLFLACVVLLRHARSGRFRPG